MGIERNYLIDEQYLKKLIEKYAKTNVLYDIDKIYLAENKGRLILVYKISENEYREFNEKNIKYHMLTEIVVHKKRSIKIRADFKKIIARNDLEVMLLDKDGNIKEQISEQEIMYIFKMITKKENLNGSQRTHLDVASVNAVNVISDLLGINVTCNRNSNYKVTQRDICESVVPAYKVQKFKRILKDYLYATLLVEKKLCLTNCNEGIDFKIARSLIVAKIKLNEQMKKNVFDFTIDADGNMTIDGTSLTNNQSGFQKIIRFK